MSAQKCDTICLPRELVEEMLLQFIIGLRASQNILTMLPGNNIEESASRIMVGNSPIVDYLLQLFPRPEEREAIINIVRERTGDELTQEFFVGEPTLADESVGKQHLDS